MRLRAVCSRPICLGVYFIRNDAFLNIDSYQRSSHLFLPEETLPDVLLIEFRVHGNPQSEKPCDIAFISVKWPNLDYLNYR